MESDSYDKMLVLDLKVTKNEHSMNKQSINQWKFIVPKHIRMLRLLLSATSYLTRHFYHSSPLLTPLVFSL